ncbi:MAG: ABC transporter permease [Lachnospiraceae bacterium]|uniref:ABC transporter permease n=1 Tax=Candidatus Merdisoma sp. JLR.KK011 TaxID=3114299 RepID=UPI0029D7B128|nr:ABC transporter permease [Lachnospiraceae bacterium]MCI9251433.1 ABC transporter permease [Lachnospiraceae bacterium]MCI9382751.1 ABC transporter permease [Lachnospiraceae bacterium]MCI9478698.1 ABC transporter permease [Lachnospiraceae bacterium]MCI9623562.1 ABC transporter permease [Lachnospiraceae bacterium]
MSKYIGKRLLMMIPVLLGVMIIVFTINFLTPGDPARMILGDGATPEALAQVTEELGLNDPYLVQLGRYIGNVVFKLNLGESYMTGKPVFEEIASRFPTTVKLAVFSVSISVLVGVFAGIISATKQYSVFDRIATSFSLLGVSMPTFWAGLMAVLIFSVKLGWLPASGSYGPEYWVLPSFTLGLHSSATVMRMTRSSMLEVIRADYIRTARAKGQKEKWVIISHALKNAMIPVVTVIGMQFGGLLGGSLLIETVFAIPGLGKYIIDSISTRDYPVVQGGVLLLAISFSLVNLLVDILYAYLDPRIKSQYKTVKRKKGGADNAKSTN